MVYISILKRVNVAKCSPRVCARIYETEWGCLLLIRVDICGSWLLWGQGYEVRSLCHPSCEVWRDVARLKYYIVNTRAAVDLETQGARIPAAIVLTTRQCVWGRSDAKIIRIIILHSQCHVCWWPGDARSQANSSNSNDLILSGYSSLDNRSIKR